MCGRFALSAKTNQIEKLVNKEPIKVAVKPRFNIAPSQNILAIKSDASDFTFLKWGLIPSWSKDPAIGNSMINARAETIIEKPSFRTPFKKKRCLIFADGYYEWKVNKGTKTKTPYFIHKSDFEPFAFAGLWESWINPDGEIIESACIITTEPNEKMKEIHHRFPVILNPNQFDLWLDTKKATQNDLLPLLVALPEEDVDFYEVSTLVNSPVNDIEDCKKPA
jgi:putative SOS response-associated peptidase YedK